MTQFLLSVCHDEDYSDADYDTPEFERIQAKVTAFNEDAMTTGTWLFGGGLKPISSATVVRSTGGSVSMTDGPYAETKEHMGGFWVLELPDLDTALDVVGRASDACERPIELRPFEGLVEPIEAADSLNSRDPMTGDPRPVSDHVALDAVFRREVGRCTATLIRVLGDLDLAEDAVAEAFAIAAQRWPDTGIPPNPGGWITTTARNRAIDRIRRESTRADRSIEAHRMAEADMEPHDDPHETDLDAFIDVVPDDQLRLMFLCCHPALSPDAQVALTLRLLGGLETPEIARAFVVSEATMAQRIVRAKRKLRDNHASYRIPPAAELPDRLHVVLAAISLIFTAGHSASRGDALVRVDLTDEAIRLARVLVELMPDEPEALGLLALLLLTDARRVARTRSDGSMVRLADQDRSLWDADRIAEGHALVRACLRRDQPGPFQIQAAIAAVHADAPVAAGTDWSQIVALFDQLLAFRPDPVVGLNRAIAVAERDGAEAGLAALEDLDRAPLAAFQPFHAARADLLVRTGRLPEARDAYDRAIELSANPVERDFLLSQRPDP